MRASLLFVTATTAVFSQISETTLSSDEMDVIRYHFTHVDWFALELGPAAQPPPKTIVLCESSRLVDRDGDWKSALSKSAQKTPQSVQEAVTDFIEKNSTPFSFSGLSLSPLKIVTLSDAALHRLFRTPNHDGWPDFATKYPHTPLITMSRIGFSKDRRFAVFSAWWSYDAYGVGEYFVLQRDGTGWKKTDIHVGWQSKA